MFIWECLAVLSDASHATIRKYYRATKVSFFEILITVHFINVCIIAYEKYPTKKAMKYVYYDTVPEKKCFTVAIRI